MTNPPGAALAGASAQPAAASPASVTKDQPFIHTLGMKCVHETRRDYQVFAAAMPGADAAWKSETSLSMLSQEITRYMPELAALLAQGGKRKMLAA